MQSLNTDTSAITDFNNAHEITDLLAPNDPGKMYSAIERRAAGWAVMDADTRLNDSAGGTGKGTKGGHKGVYSVAILCKHFAKGTCTRGDKCRFSHKSSDPKPGGKGSKGKKANNEKYRRMKCGKITNLPQWAKWNSSSSAHAVLTSTPVLSSTETAPPGLSTLANNSVNSDNVLALAAMLKDVLFLSGSEPAQAPRLATLARSAGYVVCQKFPVFAACDQSRHVSMIVDSGAEVHLVCPAQKHLLTNVTKTILQEKEKIQYSTTIWFINLFLCLKP